MRVNLIEIRAVDVVNVVWPQLLPVMDGGQPRAPLGRAGDAFFRLLASSDQLLPRILRFGAVRLQLLEVHVAGFDLLDALVEVMDNLSGRPMIEVVP